MKRNAKLALVALAGAAAGAVLARFRRPAEAPPAPPDERAEELRRKLAEARAAVVDEDDFEAAGMGAETLVEEPRDEPTPAKPEATAPEPEAPAPEPEATAAEPEAPAPEPEVTAAEPEAPAPEKPAVPKPEAQPPPAAEPPPRDEFEAMRRRIHEEGKAAAEEMRRSADPPERP